MSLSTFMITRATTPQRVELFKDTVRDALASTSMLNLMVHYWTPEAKEACKQLAHEGCKFKVKDWKVNVGQHVIMNYAMEMADANGDSHLLRLDDDVAFLTPGWLNKLMAVSEKLGEKFMLSPFVRGLKHPPERSEKVDVQGQGLYFLYNAIGGICRLHHMEALRGGDDPYVSDVRQPLGFGDATGIAKWAQRNKVWMCYLDGVEVKHRKGTKGQEKEDPSYFNEHDLFQILPYIPAWRPRAKK